jgi:DNA-directed RNA polymerase alpha subunit
MNIVDNTIVTDNSKSQLVKEQSFMETSPEKIVQKLRETGGI